MNRDIDGASIGIAAVLICNFEVNRIGTCDGGSQGGSSGGGVRKIIIWIFYGPFIGIIARIRAGCTIQHHLIAQATLLHIGNDNGDGTVFENDFFFGMFFAEMIVSN